MKAQKEAMSLTHVAFQTGSHAELRYGHPSFPVDTHEDDGQITRRKYRLPYPVPGPRKKNRISDECYGDAGRSDDVSDEPDIGYVSLERSCYDDEIEESPGFPCGGRRSYMLTWMVKRG